MTHFLKKKCVSYSTKLWKSESKLIFTIIELELTEINKGKHRARKKKQKQHVTKTKARRLSDSPTYRIG